MVVASRRRPLAKEVAVRTEADDRCRYLERRRQKANLVDTAIVYIKKGTCNGNDSSFVLSTATMALTAAEFDQLDLLPKPRLHDIAQQWGLQKSSCNRAAASRIRQHLTPMILPGNEYPVPGFDDYVIQVHGECDEARLINKFTRCEKVPFAYEGMGGWSFVNLRQGGKKSLLQYGNLMLRALVGEPATGQSCDHIDTVRDNNRISNLRWASAAEQAANQRDRMPSSTRTKPVKATDIEGDETVYISAEVAASNFVIDANDTIVRIVDGIHRSIRAGKEFRGFTWTVGPQMGEHVTEWKPIHEHFFGKDSGHMVSRCGLIKEKHGRITAGHLNSSGYRTFNHRRVHRIVAAAYVSENFDISLVVDHKDNNRSNNDASNLRWITSAENARNMTMPHAVPIVWRDLNGKLLAELPSMASGLAALKQARSGPAYIHNIQHALEGKQDTAYGFVWEYQDEHQRAAAERVRQDRQRCEKKRRPVIRVSLSTGDDVQPPFESIVLAKEACPGAVKISACCDPQNKRKSTGGYGWRYYTFNDEDPVVKRAKNASTKPKAIARVDSNGIVIPPLFVSSTNAASTLRAEGFGISDATISRRVKPGVTFDLRKEGSDEVVSRIRLATDEEIARQGPDFKVDRTPTSSAKSGWMRNVNIPESPWIFFATIREGAQRCIDLGLSKGELKTVEAKITRLFNSGKAGEQFPYRHDWALA